MAVFENNKHEQVLLKEGKLLNEIINCMTY